MPQKSLKKLLVITPLLGTTGNVINEAQLVNNLSKYFEMVYCFVPVSFRQILFGDIPKPSVPLDKRVKLIILPTLPLPIFFLPITLTYNLLISILLIIICRALSFDIIYTRTDIELALLMLKPLIKTKIMIKFGAFRLDMMSPDSLLVIRKISSRLFWITDSYLLRKSDIILVPSKFMEMNIRKEESMIKGRLVVCPAGIDMEKIKRIKKDKPPTKNSKVRIGFIGTLAWWQGVDVLAQAVSIVNKKVPNVELFIVGDGPLRKKVDEICKLNGVNCVITGFVTHEKALHYLRTFEILVLPRPRTPTTEYVIPIKVLEAWALGIPVIVSAHKVLRAMCKDREDVLFVDPDPRDIADKIFLLIRNQELREKMSKRGVMLAQNFDYKKIARNLYEKLQGICD